MLNKLFTYMYQRTSQHSSVYTQRTQEHSGKMLILMLILRDQSSKMPLPTHMPRDSLQTWLSLLPPLV